MDFLLDLVRRYPIVLLLVGAWLVGMISNVLRGRAKAREQKGQQTSQAPLPQQSSQQRLPQQRLPQQGLPQQRLPQQRAPLPQQGQTRPVRLPAQTAPRPTAGPAQKGGAQSAEEVAREMRRILGLEPDPSPAGPVRPAPSVSPPTPRRVQTGAPLPSQRPQQVRAEPSRAPLPSQPATRDRKLALHEQSHVGEQMHNRHLSGSKVGQPRADKSALGSLGGRQRQVVVHRPRSRSRNSLQDLRRAMVLAEILAPPLALRPHNDRLPGEP